MSGTREWDADTYDRVSSPQLEWGTALLERLRLRGDEVVLDAGCGSGRVTEMLVERLPSGRVIGVDGSRAMIERARRRLDGRAELIHADLLELELPEPVDAIFSSATFHWILDHDLLFARLHGCLRDGGRLEAQCGGQGNVAAFFAIVDRVSASEPFAEHLPAPVGARHFAAAELTGERLAAAGFEQVRCWLEPSPQRPPEPRAYVETVCLGAHLEALPDRLRPSFVEAVVGAWEGDGVLDYVRLNLSARKPAAS